MTPADRTRAAARAVVDRALATGEPLHDAVLVMQAMLAHSAAEIFYATVAVVGMEVRDLEASATRAAAFQASEAVELHATWQATTDWPELDARAVEVIRHAFFARINDLAGNGLMWGVLR